LLGKRANVKEGRRQQPASKNRKGKMEIRRKTRHGSGIFRRKRISNKQQQGGGKKKQIEGRKKRHRDCGDLRGKSCLAKGNGASAFGKKGYGKHFAEKKRKAEKPAKKGVNRAVRGEEHRHSEKNPRGGGGGARYQGKKTNETSTCRTMGS